jgi:hypothetical protein
MKTHIMIVTQKIIIFYYEKTKIHVVLAQILNILKSLLAKYAATDPNRYNPRRLDCHFSWELVVGCILPLYQIFPSMPLSSPRGEIPPIPTISPSLIHRGDESLMTVNPRHQKLPFTIGTIGVMRV